MLNLGCSKFRSPTIIVDTEPPTSNHGSVKTHFGCFNPHQPTIFLREPIVFIDRAQYCCKLHLPLCWLIPNFGWLTSSTGWILTSYFEDPHVWRLIIKYSSCTAIILLWLIEGILEVKLPTIWTDEKAEVRRARREQSQRGEKIRRKKMQVCEKVGKSRNTVFFRCFVAPEGRKVGSLKRRVRRHLGRWEMKVARRCGAKQIFKWKGTKHLGLGALLEVEMSKKCTPLWREAHFEFKMYKTNTPGPDHLWQLRCQKSARRCGAKHISKSKCAKHIRSGPLLAVEMSKKWTPLWREAHFEVKMYKTLHVRATFGGSDVVLRGKECAPCQKWAKREGFAAFPETMAGVGHLKRIFKDAFRVAGAAVQKTCSSEMFGGEGAHFLRGVAFWIIRSSGLLRWFCVTSAALRMTWHQFFVTGTVLYTGGVKKS